jgi:DNA polymerase III epsilon subunit family exonuclease
MIVPKDWKPFASFEEKLAFLKEIALVPKTQNYIKHFYYSGPYADAPGLCAVAGYSDRTSLVIQFGGQLHCIHADYLMDMQTGRYRLPEEYIVLDLETTGLSPKTDRIIEFAGVRYRLGTETDKFVSLINPGCGIPEDVEKINHISDEMVAGAPGPEEVLPKIRDFLGGLPVVAHNAPFDAGFLKTYYAGMKLRFGNTVLDTLALCRRAFPALRSYSLSAMKRQLGIETEAAHRALPDVYATAHVLEACAAALSAPSPAPLPRAY